MRYQSPASTGHHRSVCCRLGQAMHAARPRQGRGQCWDSCLPAPGADQRSPHCLQITSDHLVQHDPSSHAIRRNCYHALPLHPEGRGRSLLQLAVGPPTPLPFVRLAVQAKTCPPSCTKPGRPLLAQSPPRHACTGHARQLASKASLWHGGHRTQVPMPATGIPQRICAGFVQRHAAVHSAMAACKHTCKCATAHARVRSSAP